MDVGSLMRMPLHVRTKDVERVTSRSPREVDPRDAELTHDDIEAMWKGIVRLYRGGLHPAIAVCVRKHGQIVLERAIGHLRGNAPGAPKDAPKVPIRYDSLFNFFSSSKAVTAMLAHLLEQRGAIHLDDAVVEYLPEFAPHGKDRVTIRQVLTHRAGIPTVREAPMDLGLLEDWDRILGLLCNAQPLGTPGRRLAYHALTGGYVIGEIIQRVTRTDLRTFLRKEILDPLGFKTFNYGIDPSRVYEVAENASTGLPAMPPPSWFAERALGVSMNDATELSNDPRFLTAVVPSGNIIGTAEEASRFFELLLRGGTMNGVHVFDPRTIRRAVAEQSWLEVDSFLGLPIRYGTGFMLGTPIVSLYGTHSPYAYGHVGFTNVIAWADPERDISVGFMTSGKPFITPGQLRWLGAIYAIAARTRGNHLFERAHRAA
jgi:CubicO group peptidase (beta-lactamase class C family)